MENPLHNLNFLTSPMNMNDAVDHKNCIDSAAEQHSKDVSHGQVVGYIDPVKEAKMMRKFDVRNFA